jgi:signal transduction histidine kinase
MTLQETQHQLDETEARLRALENELEARAQERAAQLRQANQNLQSIAHTAAHDLRSPLRAIKGFSTLLLEEHGGHLDTEGLFLLQRIAQAADQMQQLLSDLLEYVNVAAAELSLEKVSLQDAVREALAPLQGDIGAKNAAVTVQESLPPIMGHRDTVVVLVNNLVSNALKFVAPNVRPQIGIRAESAGPRVRLSVQDNGIGVEPKDMRRLFEVFQRLNAKGAYPGTGLGLAIVREGARRMGACAGVESQPANGSRFWIEFQAA